MCWFWGLIVIIGSIQAKDPVPADFFTTVKSLVAECNYIADAFKPFSPTGIHVVVFTYDYDAMEFKKYFYENNLSRTTEIIYKIDAKDRKIQNYQFEIQSNGKTWDTGGYYVIQNEENYVGVYNGREIGRVSTAAFFLLGKHLYRVRDTPIQPAATASINDPTHFEHIGFHSRVAAWESIITTRHDIEAINYMVLENPECGQIAKPQNEWRQLIKCTPLQPILPKNGMTPEYYSLMALKLLYPSCFEGLDEILLKNSFVRFQHSVAEQKADEEEEEQRTRFIIYIVAGVLGLLGFILLIIGIIIFFMCRKRKASEKEIKVIVVKEPEEPSSLTPNKHPEGSRNNNQDSKKNNKPSKHSDTVPEQSANSGDTEKKTKNKEKVKEDTVTVTSNEKPTENDTQPPTEHSKESKNKVGKGQIPKHNDWPIPEKKDKLDITDLRRKRDHSLEIE